jgi:competence protein ComEA
MYKKQLFVLMIILLEAAGGTYYGLYSEEQAVV